MRESSSLDGRSTGFQPVDAHSLEGCATVEYGTAQDCPRKTFRQYRISFCTVAMGRLDHLRQTLPCNIEAASDYPNCEFVLLDYGSRDGLADWVKSYCMPWLDSGKLTYLRIDGPRLWLELSCQAGVVIPNISHFHTIYRDKRYDYAGDF